MAVDTQSPPDSRKVVVLGASGCGKTALVTRALENKFTAEYHATFGADFYCKVPQFSTQPALSIWCCSGHVRYRPLMEQFLLNANIALLCFDHLKQSSFLELPYWYNELKRVAPDAAIVVVGCKLDHSDDVVVGASDALRQAKEWGAEFRQVSSKTGVNIGELFGLITQ